MVIFLCAMLFYLLVIRPLDRAVVKKWGMVGKIWTDRIFYLAVICLLLNATTTIGIVVWWFYVGALVTSMVYYNPWNIKAALAKRRAFIEEIEMEKKDDGEEEL